MGRKRQGAAVDPVARRIRARRVERGFSLRGLARAAHLQAGSHVLHIENGEKVPSPAVAVRLAEALGDDVALYRAWATARHRGDLATTLAAAAEVERRLEPARGGAAPAGVALIAADHDPGDAAEPACAVLDRVVVDPRVLGAADAAVGAPFAVRVTAAMAARCRGALRAGEVAVVARGQVDPLFPHRVYAVRHAGGVVLGHAVTVADTVVVAGREPDVPEIHVAFDPRRRVRVLLGRVVLTLRPWL
jgi:transcriptional regulator with XRE-family HTH domain